MRVALFSERLDQLLDLGFAGTVLDLNRLLVFLFEKLKVSFRQLNADEVFNLVNGRLTVFLL